jgi:hypothetical protein
MSRLAFIALYALAMVSLIVAVDIAFLRGLFWQRLLVNVAIVVAFGAITLIFLRPG